jgi:threonylcarbamoyladenosine tRNA methylthiotransferase MtaB
LGCRLNLAESGAIAQQFVDRGHKIVEFGQEADIIFINTCTVTGGADSDCRNIIRRARRSSPESKIIVTGCFAQVEKEKVFEIEDVDLVLGNDEKFNVFDYIDKLDAPRMAVGNAHVFHPASTTTADDHTRAFLKIQDGCNYFCSYCIIPFARGRSRAASIANVVVEAKNVLEKGFKEIVLTGVNVGEYESSTGERLTDLLKALAGLEQLKRIRISSIEPNTLTDELLEVIKSSSKFMEHFHIPLQSGDDKMLTIMKRKYDTGFFRELVLKIRTMFPNAGIGADIIVGHPGETDASFENTFNFVKELPLTHFHIFSYSKREGTLAARSTDQIDSKIKKVRTEALRELCRRKTIAFAKGNVGTTHEVLFEQRDREGLFAGHTPNFLKVHVETAENLVNEIRQVTILSYEGGKLRGELKNTFSGK